MLVDEVMNRSIRTVNKDNKVLEVASIMCLYRIPGLPVVEDDCLVGYIAEKDILSFLFPSLEEVMDGSSGKAYDNMQINYGDATEKKVHEIMTKTVISVRPDTHVLKAAAIMATNKFRRIPVVEDGKLMGVVSLGDVHKALFKNKIASC